MSLISQILLRNKEELNDLPCRCEEPGCSCCRCKRCKKIIEIKEALKELKQLMENQKCTE